MKSVIGVVGKKKIKRICLVACAVVAVMLVAILVSCSAAKVAKDSGVNPAIGEALAEVVDAADAVEIDPETELSEELIEGQDQNAASNDASAPNAGEGNALTAQSSSSEQSPAAPKAQSATERPTPSATQKKWVENTEQVWVEDRAAWSEQVPVYGSKEVSICNVCGADVTGIASAHGKTHMLAGEGSGHHSEVRQIVTGYNTVNHPAEGHYETRVVGGHWE